MGFTTTDLATRSGNETDSITMDFPLLAVGTMWRFGRRGQEREEGEKDRIEKEGETLDMMDSLSARAKI